MRYAAPRVVCVRFFYRFILSLRGDEELRCQRYPYHNESLSDQDTFIICLAIYKMCQRMYY